MKTNNSILNKPYTIYRSGKTYPKVRSWIPNFCKFIENLIKADKSVGHEISMFTAEAPTGSTKLMAMATAAEYFPNCKNILIIIHQSNLKDQHRQDIPDLIKQGWLTKHIQIQTYQKIRSLIEKDFSDLDLSEEDKRLLNFIQKVDTLFLDEIHRYSTDKDVVSLPKILNYLKSHSLKLAGGITATSKHCEGWYRIIENLMPVQFYDAYYERKFILKKSDAAKDGIIILPEIVFINTSLKLDLEVGEFIESKSELLEKTSQQLSQLAQLKYSQTVKDTDPKSLRDKTKEFDVAASRLREHLDEFINNRMKETVFILNQPQQQGKPSLVYVPLQKDADQFKKFYNKTKKKLKHKFECAVWHGNSDDYFQNSAESKKIQLRLQDPLDPLKVVVLVGMWREGTDLQNLNQVHDCHYTPNNTDSTDQKKGRLRNGGIYFAYLDALNSRQLLDIHKSNLQKTFGEDHDDKWFQSVQEALHTSQFDDEPEQSGSIKNFNDYAELDSDINENLEDVFGISNTPTIVGWIKQVHKGDTTCLVVPSSTFTDPKIDSDKLSEKMKLENLFRLLNVA